MAIFKQLKQTTCTLRKYLTWYCGYWAVSDKYLMRLCDECCLLDAMKLDKPTLRSLLDKKVTITDIPNYMGKGGPHAVHIKGDGIEFFISAMDNAFSDEEESIL
jgi:hypothetical protein